jgi:phosphoribosylaminoimidazolecarboxamide formyltransferase/IMP cyclohydrolase
MSEKKRIRSALISVYHKEGLDVVAKQLSSFGVQVYSTGGTASYLEGLGMEVLEVAELTGYPSILNGRVKTLHPKVHGGILARRDMDTDVAELESWDIPEMDLVIVDLYPFEATVASGATEADIIEKIDIGGIALIRAAAKNFRDVVVIPSQAHYAPLAKILEDQQGATTLAQRRHFAGEAFDISSHYDTQIFRYLNPDSDSLKISVRNPLELRYGENPHQKGWYYGDLEANFTQLNGKALSYNNLVDIEGALQLVDEFDEPFFAVIKHTNPCGCATGKNLAEAWERALAGDPVSAFGGILACNGTVDETVAKAMHSLFFEVLVADGYTAEALELLSKKKNRILLLRKNKSHAARMSKRLLNGFLVQERDTIHATTDQLSVQSDRQPTEAERMDIIFGDKVVKHLKSNAIALVKNGQLIGSGMGQTSRIDALRQCIAKAQAHGFDTKGAVLASDAFFPFSDSVELAMQYGIETIVEPGGSIRDAETIEFCKENNLCLVFTGIRHFKH